MKWVVNSVVAGVSQRDEFTCKPRSVQCQTRQHTDKDTQHVPEVKFSARKALLFVSQMNAVVPSADAFTPEGENKELTLELPSTKPAPRPPARVDTTSVVQAYTHTASA